MSDTKSGKDKASETVENENPRQAESASDAVNESEQAATEESQDIEADIRRRLAQVRSKVRESFGAVVMAMMLLPRYRHQALADLQFLLLEPMIRNRVAIAHAETSGMKDIAGVAIWASVSEEVDAKIREQIRHGVFPVRLKPEEWTSGSINWLLDIFTPDERTAAALIANFRKITEGGELRIHPVVAHNMSREMLEKLGLRVKQRGKMEEKAAEASENDGKPTENANELKQKQTSEEAEGTAPEEDKKLH